MVGTAVDRDTGGGETPSDGGVDGQSERARECAVRLGEGGRVEGGGERRKEARRIM